MQTPEWAKTICSGFGKVGQSPRYRVIWAPDRAELCFGRLLRIYGHLGDRWIIEELVPWEKFGPWDYEAFGPKPPDGDYSHCHTIQAHTDGTLAGFYHLGRDESRMVSLEDFGHESLQATLTVLIRSRAVPAWQTRNNRLEAKKEAEKREHEDFEAVYDNNLGLLHDLKKTADDNKIVVPLVHGVTPTLAKAMKLKPVLRQTHERRLA